MEHNHFSPSSIDDAMFPEVSFPFSFSSESSPLAMHYPSQMIKNEQLQVLVSIQYYSFRHVTRVCVAAVLLLLYESCANINRKTEEMSTSLSNHSCSANSFATLILMVLHPHMNSYYTITRYQSNPTSLAQATSQRKPSRHGQLRFIYKKNTRMYISHL